MPTTDEQFRVELAQEKVDGLQLTRGCDQGGLRVGLEKAGQDAPHIRMSGPVERAVETVDQDDQVPHPAELRPEADGREGLLVLVACWIEVGVERSGTVLELAAAAARAVGARSVTLGYGPTRDDVVVLTHETAA